jgi:flagellar hook-basal body complex protein FliE
MTAIPAIGAIEAIGGPAEIGGVAPTSGIGATGAAGGPNFASALADGLQHVQDVQGKADDLAVKAATGSLTDVHDYMIASTEASLATQLTVAVRNKALDAFNEIMRMQA